MYQLYSNENAGNFPEAMFVDQTIADLCALDMNQPICFEIKYEKVMNPDVSDKE